MFLSQCWLLRYHMKSKVARHGAAKVNMETQIILLSAELSELMSEVNTERKSTYWLWEMCPN